MSKEYNPDPVHPASLYEEILHRQDPEQTVHLSRFFKTGKGRVRRGRQVPRHQGARGARD